MAYNAVDASPSTPSPPTPLIPLLARVPNHNVVPLTTTLVTLPRKPRKHLAPLPRLPALKLRILPVVVLLRKTPKADALPTREAVARNVDALLPAERVADSLTSAADLVVGVRGDCRDEGRGEEVGGLAGGALEARL